MQGYSPWSSLRLEPHTGGQSLALLGHWVWEALVPGCKFTSGSALQIKPDVREGMECRRRQRTGWGRLLGPPARFLTSL